MSLVMRSLIFFLTLLILRASPGGEIYRWVDSQGRQHFGDYPPVEVVKQAVKLRINTYTNPVITDQQGLKSSRNDVVLYSASWCGVCKRAKNYFRKHQIQFSEFDVERSQKGIRDFRAMKGRGVPIILVGGRRMNGFSAAQFQRIYGR